MFDDCARVIRLAHNVHKCFNSSALSRGVSLSLAWKLNMLTIHGYDMSHLAGRTNQNIEYHLCAHSQMCVGLHCVWRQGFDNTVKYPILG